MLKNAIYGVDMKSRFQGGKEVIDNESLQGKTVSDI